MSVQEILDLDLTAAASLVRSRQVSARELVTAALTRIGRWQPRINCFIDIRAKAALAQADERDRAQASGEALGPFHGLPLAHKDLFWGADKRPTCGSRVDMGEIAAHEAPALARLAAAGAIDLGGLNLAEFAFGPTGHNIHFGDCLNPYNPARISGGSSSGSAAAVAARLVYAALGSDTGGSVRTPASLCNVVGYKPTYDRISRAGMMPLAPSFDTVGVLARSVSDCALMLAALGEPNKSGFSPRLDGRPGRIRIGVPEGWFDDELDPDCARAFADALNVLRGMGLTVTTVQITQIPAILAAMRTILLAEAAGTHAAYYPAQAHLYCGLARTRIEEGRKIKASDYERTLEERGTLIDAFLNSAFQEADVIVTPTMTQTAPFAAAGDIRVNASEPFSRSLTTTTRPANYLGLPALSVPAGFTGDGMPFGIQFMARPFADALLLDTAAAYEAETRWAQRLPEWTER